MNVDFLGIGAQKGGTTWLYHQLGRHPQIAFPAGKEVHFWNRCDPAVADRWIAALQPPSRLTTDGRPIRCGEITPAYATLDPDTIRALQRTCPAIRLFISLRNPLTRAWSAAMMALVRAQMLEHEASDQWFIDHFRSQASRQRAAYADTLTRWWDAFPQDQMFVTLLDDIATRPAEVLAGLAAHLRIDTADFGTLTTADTAAVVVPRVGLSTAAAPPPCSTIRPTLVPVLQALYATEIERLGRLLGRDLGGWLADHGSATVPSGGETGSRVAVDCRGQGTVIADTLAASHPSSSGSA